METKGLKMLYVNYTSNKVARKKDGKGARD